MRMLAHPRRFAMPASILGLVSLLLPAIAAANPLSVEVVSCESAAQKSRIATSAAGKALPHVQLSIYDLNYKNIRVFASDSQGAAFLPKLPPGQYVIVARAPSNLRAEVCLEIATDAGRKKSFSLALRTMPPEPPTLEEELAAVKRAGASERLRQFRGVVKDPSGTAIRGVSIEVYKNGARNGRHTTRTRSDGAGGFSVSLSEGVYVIAFEFAGFQTRYIAIEIAPDAEDKDLPVSLQLGAMSE